MTDSLWENFLSHRATVARYSVPGLQLPWRDSHGSFLEKQKPPLLFRSDSHCHVFRRLSPVIMSRTYKSLGDMRLKISPNL